MLNERERQRLTEIASALGGDDPAFVRRLSGHDLHETLRHRIAVAIGIAGVIGAVLGLWTANVALAVAAICVVGVAGGVASWRAADGQRR
jgi:hypothetical protein